MAQLYRVTTPEGDLIMIAPLMTVSIAFNLHTEAADRVKREAIDNDVCALFANWKGFGPFSMKSIIVQREPSADDAEAAAAERVAYGNADAYARPSKPE